MAASIRKSLGGKTPAELFLPEGAFNFVDFLQSPESLPMLHLDIESTHPIEAMNFSNF
jgi:hypothetical protein